MPTPILIEGLDSRYIVLCWANGLQAAIGPDGRWRSNRPATQKLFNERYSPIPDKYQTTSDAVTAYALDLAMALEAEVVRYPSTRVLQPS